MSPTASITNSSSRRGPVASFDHAILLCVLLLACFGLVMVYSVSSVRASQLYGDEFYFLKRQAVALGLGLAFLAASARAHPETWRRLSYPLLGVSVLLLAAVLVPGLGVQVGGARRWLRISGFTFQPSELAKLAAVLYLARSISRKEGKMELFRVGIFTHAAVLGVIAVLLLAEPDMGTVLTLALAAAAMLFAGGARLKHLFLVGLSLVPMVGALIYVAPYRMRRVLTFLDPWSSPQGDGFQIVQSFLAFGSGGVAGQGLGDSRQKLFFLPEAHTDFILSVIGEELGFVGVSLVIAAFVFLLVRGLRVSLRAADPFQRLLATGLTLLLAAEAFTNAAVVLGLLPTKGLALPFVSFGGSSLVVSLWAAGILLSVSAKG